MNVLELWAAVKLQTDDKPEAQLLALRLRDDCKAGAVEHETREQPAPQRRIAGYLGRAPAAPRPPARTVPGYYVSAGAFVRWLYARKLEPSPRVRAWMLASGEAAPEHDEPMPARTDALSGVLKMARAQAGADDWHSVWAALVQLAQSAKRTPPLLGYVEGEGVKYEAHDGSVKFFKREALRKRLERSEKKP